uniref:Uncharacterized protein n=1 Tax=Sphaerodactylus townsendi TaxID=933632 RepID=A0ACB8F4V6_9SAUR
MQSDCCWNTQELPKEDKWQYTPGEAPDFDISAWKNEKDKLGLDFPNLPYLIDGETKITQSNAILRYIGRKHNMCGESEEELIRVDMFENHIMDFRDGFWEKTKALNSWSRATRKTEAVPRSFGERKWFAGKRSPMWDFHAFMTSWINSKSNV